MQVFLASGEIYDIIGNVLKVNPNTNRQES